MAIRDELIPYNDPITASSVEAILPRLFRDIRDQMGIPENKFEILIERYISRRYPEFSAKKKSSTKHNYIGYYSKVFMMWRVFSMGFDIMCAKEFAFALTAKFAHQDLNEAFATVTCQTSFIRPGDDPITQEFKNEEALSILYKELQFRAGVTVDNFEELFARYAKKLQVPDNVAIISSTKGNLKKELGKKRMSWNNFVKALIFLTVYETNIAVYVKMHNGVVIKTYLRVILDADDLSGFEDECQGDEDESIAETANDSDGQ